MRSALSLLTPFGGARTPDPRTADWFALIGAGLGLLLGGLWWGSSHLWRGAALPAALVVVADLALTGMLHFDGLVDSADGLLPHLARDRRLAVMASPEVGAFGVAAGGSCLLVRWAALASVRPNVFLLVGLWGLSRTGMAVILRSQPYARSGGGLASALIGPSRWALVALGIIAMAGLILVWSVVRGGPVVAGAAIGVFAVTWLARRRIGGYTGDVLGAAGVMAETVGLVVAAARW